MADDKEVSMSLKLAYLSLVSSSAPEVEIPMDCDLKMCYRGHLMDYCGSFTLSSRVPAEGGCGLGRDYSIEFEDGPDYHFAADASRWSHSGNKLELSLGDDDFLRLID